MFTALDRDSGQVECVYTGRSVTVGAEKPDPTDMNTEHTWPQSWGADVIPAKCDLHHLFPSDAEANQVRADLPFGEVTSSTEWSQGGSSRGLSASGEAVFEPRDEHKGNVARAMLYFATRYQHSIDTHELNLYERWHSLDPVDIFELDRSLEILRRQGNINPYVACPFAVERLTDGD